MIRKIALFPVALAASYVAGLGIGAVIGWQHIRRL